MRLRDAVQIDRRFPFHIRRKREFRGISDCKDTPGVLVLLCDKSVAWHGGRMDEERLTRYTNQIVGPE